MSRPVILVDELSKSYQIGQKADPNASFREVLVDRLRAPFAGLRRSRSRSGGGGDLPPDSFWALKDLSFEVAQGDVIGIIGRNGAGKSTLLKILSRITEPTSGEVRLRGRVASLLEVGTGFHPELSGRENIYLNGSILGMRRSEIDRKFDEIVDFAEIEAFLDTPVKRYSSGMYVRLAFAVAAHLEPEILIVDEVLAVGDAAFQQKCIGKMGEVTKLGRTVLFVSHNMAAVRSLCKSCCVIERGRLALLGPVEAGIDHYLRTTLPSDIRPTAHFPRPVDLHAPWMRSARLISGDVEAGAIPMGRELRLVVEFESSTPMRYPKLGFTITDAEGNCLLNANNRYQPSNELGASCSEGMISCDLGMVPLMPGRYSVSLWFGDHAHDSHTAESALTFEVIERDIWGAGHTPPPCSPFWWPTRFEIAEAHPTGKSPFIGLNGS